MGLANEKPEVSACTEPFLCRSCCDRLATFIPSFFGRHADEQVIKALLCSGAAYGIGRLATWAIKGFYE